MFLAKRFVFLGEEGLAFESGAAHRADEAGVVPGVTEGLQELVSSLNGELTAMAAGPKHTVEVLFTVRFSVLQVEDVVSDWLLTASAQKAVEMPRLLEGIYHLPQYLGLAAAACGSQEIFIAVFTVDGSLFLHKAYLRQGYMAVGTGKFLLMPRFPHRYQKRSSDHHVAVGTHGRPSPSGDVLGHLDQGVLIFRVGLR